MDINQDEDVEEILTFSYIDITVEIVAFFYSLQIPSYC